MKSSYTYNRPVVNTYLIRNRDLRRLRELLLIGVVMLALGGTFLTYTWIHIEVLKTGYHLESLARDLEAQQQQERRLEIEEAYLRSPRVIWKRAANELGMIPVDIDRMVVRGRP